MKKKIEKLKDVLGEISFQHILGNRKKINEIIDHLNQANGETPEVDNTVGQTLLRNRILFTLRNFTKEPWTENSIGENDLITELLYHINESKPVETSKENPFIINELKTLTESVMLNPRIQRDYAMKLFDKILTLKGL